MTSRLLLPVVCVVAILAGITSGYEEQLHGQSLLEDNPNILKRTKREDVSVELGNPFGSRQTRQANHFGNFLNNIFQPHNNHNNHNNNQGSSTPAPSSNDAANALAANAVGILGQFLGGVNQNNPNNHNNHNHNHNHNHRPQRPHRPHQHQPGHHPNHPHGTDRNTTVLGGFNVGNVPIHLTGGQNGGLAIAIGQQGHGQDPCNNGNGGCSQGCRAQGNRASCFCNPGYYLLRNRVTCQDIDECRFRQNGGCSHICTNTDGSFTCSCYPPFALQADAHSCARQNQQQVQSCQVNNGGCSHGCSQNNFGAICYCTQGFTLGTDQKTCQDMDECQRGNGGCTQLCNNTEGSYVCACSGGLTLLADRRSCGAAPQSCAVNNGGCEQSCSQQGNRVMCFCQTGYQLSPADRQTCIDVNECQFRNAGCRQVCNNSPGSYTCACNTGSTLLGDGHSCSSPQQACTGANSKICTQVCNIVNNRIICSCNTGYFLQRDRRSCNDFNECQVNNGGCAAKTCINTPGSFTCQGQVTPQTIAPPTIAPPTKGPATIAPPTGTPPASKGCGKNSKKSLFRRIVGGNVASPKDWPWMAALLQKRRDNQQYCGGTLITPQHILTAAHCVHPFTAPDIGVRLGEYNFDTFDDNSPTDFSVADIRSHENYDTSSQENDIAIIKIDRAATFNEFIWPVCLPEGNDDYAGRRGYVTGWGTTSFSGPTSSVLREVVVPVWNHTECSKSYPGKVFPKMMCAGFKLGKKDSCQGDSGGPFQVQALPSQRWVVAGVVSWGINCAQANNPGVYTRVNKYIGWIKQNSIF